MSVYEGASRKNTRRIGRSFSLSSYSSLSLFAFRPFSRPTLGRTFPLAVFSATLAGTKTRSTTNKDVRKRRTERKHDWESERSFHCGNGGGACSPIVKLTLITATNYPAVIRVLSERYPGRYPPLPTLCSTEEPSRHHPNHYRALEPYPAVQARGSERVTRRKRFHPKHEGPLLSPFTANEVILSS